MLYCEAFLTTYRTFISPEELIKKLQYRYPSQACSRQPVQPFLLASDCHLLGSCCHWDGARQSCVP